MRNGKRIALALILLLLVVVFAFTLSSCQPANPTCNHQWKDADCTTPKTCTLCSATEGEALGHTGGTATCTEKAKCSVCNAEYGEVKGHDFNAATCTDPKICKNCEATDGNALGHAFGGWTSNGDGTHTRVCSNDATHKETKNCQGGTATCENKATCADCGAAYGSTAGHDWNAWTSNGNGTHTKTCKNNTAHSVTEDCSGGTATCEAKPVCAGCNAAYGEALSHNFGAWVSNGDGTHTKTCQNNSAHKVTENCVGGDPTCEEGGTCTVCNDEYCDAINHNWGAWVSNGDGTHTKTCKNDATHKVTENCNGKATCTEKAKCTVCNTEYGSVLGHAYGAWTSNGNGTHTHTCANNSEHKETLECTGGTATCTDKAVCKDCNTAYGEALDHNFGSWVSNGNGTHTRVCARNEEHTETKNCQGGNATCTEKAICSDCNTAYGEALDHQWSAWTSNGDGTHTRVCGRNAEHTETENCQGGTATCTDKAICSDCNTAYGEALDHQWSAWTSNGDDTHTRVCGRNEEHTETKSCQGGNATCTDKPVCSDCNTAYGEEKGHAYPDEWTAANNGTHIKVCANDSKHKLTEECSGGSATCTAQAVCEVCEVAYGTKADHVFTKKIDEAKYIVTAATCTEDAVYAFACETCGEKGTETYTAENTALDHQWSEWTSNGDGTHTRVCARDDEHTETKNCHGGTATCTDKAVCSDCEEEYGEEPSHSWNDGEVTTPDTCTAAGVKTFTCTVDGCGANKTENFDDITDHDYSGEGTVVTEPTCTEKGYTTYTCQRGGCDHSYVGNEVEAAGHSWNRDAVDCENGRECIAEGCDAEQDALGHDYQYENTEPTCTEAGKKITTCSRCDFRDEETTADAKGHDITGLTPTEELVNEEGNKCKYIQVYICKTENCGERVEGDTVYHHEYVASIETAPTCMTVGVKKLTCKHCGDVMENTEANKDKWEIPVDTETGHTWNEGTPDENGKRVDTCTECGITNTVIVATGNEASSNASDLADVDLQLKVEGSDGDKTANIQLGEDVANAIGDQNITVSAGTVDKGSLGLDETLSQQVGTNTVYDFNIKDANDNPISDFGEDNFVTITLPYELKDNEDIDSIAVWFISDKCQVENCENGEECSVAAHRLTSIKATYNNGFVTFKTNHFSVYTVTKLTPEERCALYGCNYSYSTVEGDCLHDGYTLRVCLRCHESKKLNVVEADGHDYDEGTETPATCTASGKIVYKCKDCDSSYTVRINALGHNYVEGETTPASCESAGKTVYTCQNEGCGKTREVAIAQLKHELTSNEFEADCENSGYTLVECVNCDYEYKTAITKAYGHKYTHSFVWSEDKSEATLVLTCQHNDTHMIELEATVTVTETAATCAREGKTDYVAKANYNGVTFNDKQTVVGEKLEHSYSEELKHNANQHWYECVNCYAKKDVTAHEYGEGTVTRVADCMNEGEVVYLCSCGATKTEKTSPVDEHAYVGGICQLCGKKNGLCDHNVLYDFVLDLTELGLCAGKLPYKACECGEVVYLDPENMDDFNCEGETEREEGVDENGNPYMKMSSVCESCGMVLKAYVTAVMEGCTFTATYSYSFYMPDGVTPILENAFSIEQYENHDTEFKRIELSEVGGCGGYISGYVCKNCGVMTSIDMLNPDCNDDNGVEGSYTDANGVVHYTMTVDCPDCELKYVKEMWAEGESVCEQITHMALYVYRGDELLVEYEQRRYQDNHVWETKYDMKGDSCEDGYTVIRTCTQCGAVSSWENEGHTYSENETTLDLSSLGCCGGTIRGRVCAVCGEFIDVYGDIDIKCDMQLNEDGCYEYTDKDGNLREREEYVCSECGFVFVEEMWLVVKNECVSREYDLMAIYKGEDCVFKYVQIYEDNKHVWEETFELEEGKTCEDGYRVIRKCSVCGDEEYWFTSGHNIKDTELQAADYGMCGDVLWAEQCTICGKITNIEPECEIDEPELSEIIGDDGIAHYVGGVTCETCGTYFYMDMWLQPADKCYIEIHQNMTVSREGVTLFEVDYVERESKHDFERQVSFNNGVDCSDGYSVTERCKNCGIGHGYSGFGHNYDYEKYDSSTLGCCGGMAYVGKCTVCGKISPESRLDFECNIEDAEPEEVVQPDGSVHYVIRVTCPDCGITHVMEQWVNVESECVTTYYRYYTSYDADGNVVFELPWEDKEESHEWQTSYVFNGDSCYEGYQKISTCTKCKESKTVERYDHDYEKVEIDLSKEYGMCNGHIFVERCAACKQEFHKEVNVWGCYWENVESDVPGLEKFVCNNCGAVRYYSYSQSEKDENCEFTVYSVEQYWFGGVMIFENINNYNAIAHTWKTTFEMNGNSCEDGYTVYMTCIDCDHTETSEAKEHYEYNLEIYDLEKLGVSCGGRIVLHGCPCRERVWLERSLNCKFEWNNEYEQGRNGEHYICSDCGLKMDSVIERVPEGCYICEYATYTFTLGENVIVDSLRVSRGRMENHSYTYTVELRGNSCDDGYIVHYKCSACDYGYDEEREGHGYYFEKATYDLTEYGACYGFFTVSECACGQYVSYNQNGCGDYSFDRQYVDEETGITHSVSYRQCSECGSRLDEDHYTVGDGCVKEMFVSFAYSVNGEVKFTVENAFNGTSENHKYRFTYELEGESCYDGAWAYATCRDCQKEFSEYVTYHCEFTTHYDLAENGACGGEFSFSVCPCGEYVHFNASPDCEMEYSEQNVNIDGVQHKLEMRTCKVCGLTLVYDYYNVKQECTVYRCCDFTMSLGEKGLFSVSYVEHSWDEHNLKYSFNMYGESCEDGFTYTEECADCDYYYEGYECYSHNMFMTEKHYFADYGACGGYIELCSCACGYEKDITWNIDCDYEQIDGRTEDGRRTVTYKATDCGLVIRFTYYTANAENCVVEDRYIVDVTLGDTVIVDGYDVVNSRGTHHSYEYRLEAVDGNCENGYTAYVSCKNCNYSNTETGYDHSAYRVEHLDLEDNGACYGSIDVYKCACGENSWRNLYTCCNTHTSNEYEEDGVTYYVNAYACSTCGLRYQSVVNYEYDDESCTRVEHYSDSISINGEAVALLEYELYSDNHNYKRSLQLAEGATSCEDGVIATYACTRCGEGYTNHFSSHEQAESERYNLADYGSVCGGYLVVNSCACGRYNSAELDADCLMDVRETDIWFDCYGWNDCYTYTCAVTDPACAFKIRYAYYSIKDENSCIVKSYKVWQLGYNEADGSYACQVVYATGASYISHSFSNKESVEGTWEGGTTVTSRNECSVCGSYSMDTVYFDAQNREVKSDYCEFNAVEYSDSYREYRRIYEYQYLNDNCYTTYYYTCQDYFDGTKYEDEEGYELINGYRYMVLDRELHRYGYWYKFVYTYDGCNRTANYTNSEGETNNYTEEYHHTYYKQILDPTCTQEGIYGYVCHVCDKLVSSHVEEPRAHSSWSSVYDEETGEFMYYQCDTCGLKNANGASGEIVLEDMTEAYGNGESYVVGYWNRTEKEFLVQVSLILKNASEGQDNEVFLELEATERTDIRAYQVNIAELEAAAAEAGYEAGTYYVQVTFVPFGADGSYDYSITIE